MNTLARNVNERLNTMIEEGAFMEAFEQFYALDVWMQENETEPRKGKDLNRVSCAQFVEAYPDLKLTILSVAYGPNLSIQEVLFNYTDPNGIKVNYPEVAVRKWRDNKVISEKFYYSVGDYE